MIYGCIDCDSIDRRNPNITFEGLDREYQKNCIETLQALCNIGNTGNSFVPVFQYKVSEPSWR